MTTKNKKGFTLIELLVVVAILGLLATIVAVSLTSARARARDARRVSDVRQIELALELYYAANQEYPTSTTAFTQMIEDGYLNMSDAPKDPQTGQAYCYAWGYEDEDDLYPYQFYHIGAHLENVESDMLSSDRDFDSATYIGDIDWETTDVADCISSDLGFGFDASDDITDAIYDRGVLPRDAT